MKEEYMRIKGDTKELLDKLKIYHRQSYNDVVKELIRFYIENQQLANAMEQPATN